MRTTACIALAAALLAGGCHHRRHHFDVVYDPGATWYYRYDNGHPLAATSTDPFILAAENDLLNRINSHRVANGRSALVDEPATRDLARAHSIHMAIHDFTGNVNPEGDDPGDRADHVGIAWTDFAENVVFGETDAAD